VCVCYVYDYIIILHTTHIIIQFLYASLVLIFSAVLSNSATDNLDFIHSVNNNI